MAPATACPPPGGHDPQGTDCSLCHGSVVRADNSFVAPGLHINGVVNMDNVHPGDYAQADQHGPDFNDNPQACTGCHGDDLLGRTRMIVLEVERMSARREYDEHKTDYWTWEPEA